MTYEAYRAWRDRPIEGPPSLSVIIPAYNEAERILPTVGAFAVHLSNRGQPWELIVSDDGSVFENFIQLSTDKGGRTGLTHIHYSTFISHILFRAWYGLGLCAHGLGLEHLSLAYSPDLHPVHVGGGFYLLFVVSVHGEKTIGMTENDLHP